MRKIWRKQVRTSCRNVSGKPVLFPNQSRPARREAGALVVVGPPAMELSDVGELTPPEAKALEATERSSFGSDVGNARGSWILPFIHR